MRQYDVSAWYWIVAGDETKLWSSAGMAYVAADDAGYEAWLSAGGHPTRIVNAAELAEVIEAQWLPGHLAAGVAVNSTATPGLDATYACDADAQAKITALSTGIAAGKPLPGGGASFNYRDMAGANHAFTGPDFLNFAAAIEGYIYGLIQALGTRIAGGEATLPTTPLAIA